MRNGVLYIHLTLIGHISGTTVLAYIRNYGYIVEKQVNTAGEYTVLYVPKIDYPAWRTTPFQARLMCIFSLEQSEFL
jgi:hypothetical protein